MTTRVPLHFGLVAEVESEDSDRAPYVPPPIARGEHHEQCGCDACRGTAKPVLQPGRPG
jgi:hypothetical protein